MTITSKLTSIIYKVKTHALLMVLNYGDIIVSVGSIWLSRNALYLLLFLILNSINYDSFNVVKIPRKVFFLLVVDTIVPSLMIVTLIV